MAELDAYGTHLAPLLAALAGSQGDVLECGAGHYSTPLLHALCGAQGRQLLTLEAKAPWLETFADLRCDWHRLEAVGSWDAYPWERVDVAVALVDHDVHRAPVVRALRGRARFVVAHDTEASCSGYGDAFEAYDWAWTYERYSTWATIAGMGLRPAWLEAALSPGRPCAPRPYR